MTNISTLGSDPKLQSDAVRKTNKMNSPYVMHFHTEYAIFHCYSMKLNLMLQLNIMKYISRSENASRTGVRNLLNREAADKFPIVLHLTIPVA